MVLQDGIEFESLYQTLCEVTEECMANLVHNVVMEEYDNECYMRIFKDVVMNYLKVLCR